MVVLSLVRHVSVLTVSSTTDKPTAPEDLVVSDVFAETCKLSWKPPADDGGGAIAGECNEPLSLRHQLPKFYCMHFVCYYCCYRH